MEPIQKKSKNDKYSCDVIKDAIKKYLLFPNADNKQYIKNIFTYYSVLELFVLTTTKNGKNGDIQLSKLSKNKNTEINNNSIFNVIKDTVIAEKKKLVTTDMIVGNSIRFF